jgi:hypothetical protein
LHEKEKKSDHYSIREIRNRTTQSQPEAVSLPKGKKHRTLGNVSGQIRSVFAFGSVSSYSN